MGLSRHNKKIQKVAKKMHNKFGQYVMGSVRCIQHGNFCRVMFRDTVMSESPCSAEFHFNEQLGPGNSHASRTFGSLLYPRDLFLLRYRRRYIYIYVYAYTWGHV